MRVIFFIPEMLANRNLLGGVEFFWHWIFINGFKYVILDLLDCIQLLFLNNNNNNNKRIT